MSPAQHVLGMCDDVGQEGSAEIEQGGLCDCRESFLVDIGIESAHDDGVKG